MFGKTFFCLFCKHSSLFRFLLDLKKLIKYDGQEASPRGATEVQIQAGPTSINIQRLFEAHTINSKSKQKEKPKEQPQKQQKIQKHNSLQKGAEKQSKQQIKTSCKPQQLSETKHINATSSNRYHETVDKPQHQPLSSRHRFRTPSYKEITDAFDDIHLKPDEKPSRVKSADAARLSRKDSAENEKEKQKKHQKVADKENIPSANVVLQPAKSKMWIRPRSGSQVNRKTAKKTDPVALYQAYQKDWNKFKNNICESSHSDLRWTIREKMMGNQ